MIKSISIVALMLSGCLNPTKSTAQNELVPVVSSIYNFKVESLEGGTIDLSQFRGKKILIVNTASKCGYTKQYEGLQKLYDTYKEKLVIVGFPANNFGGQEPSETKDPLNRQKKSNNESSQKSTSIFAKCLPSIFKLVV